MKPGQPGGSHPHQFFGAVGTNAFSKQDGSDPDPAAVSRLLIEIRDTASSTVHATQIVTLLCQTLATG